MAKQAAAKKPPPTLNVARGDELPPRIIVYGSNGVGKTTLAADIGKGIMVDCEGGADHTPVDIFHFDDGRRIPGTLEEVHQAINAIVRADHEYDTLILDGLDELERLIWDYVCRTNTTEKGKVPDNIEGFGWQRGYKIAVGEWRRLAEGLEFLRRRRKMAIVLVGHTETNTVANPTGDDYDRFGIMLHKRAAGFLYGWADVVGFMSYEFAVGSKPSNKDKSIATATGARILHLRDGMAWAAKARSKFEVPAEVEIPRDNPWAPVAAALKGETE